MTAGEAEVQPFGGVRGYAAESLRQHLQRRSIAIIFIEGGEATKNGSGTCIQVTERFFVATAAHNIRGRGPAQLALASLFCQRHSPIPVSSFGYRGGEQTGDLDIGWIELTPEEAERTGQTFVSVDRLLPHCNYLDNGLTHTFGLPSSLIVSAREGVTQHLGLAAITHISVTLAPDAWLAEGNPDIDIYLSYCKEGQTRTGGQPLEFIHPAGMSGGGIWINPTPEDAIWSPDSARLIGIEKSAWPDKGFMRGTQIQHWPQMMAEDHPELRPAIWPDGG